jgi:hypothetical protein
MLEYVLVVYMFNDFKNPEYVGHFRDCKSATTYQKKHYPNHQSSKCLLEQYILLPKNLKRKEIYNVEGK